MNGAYTRVINGASKVVNATVIVVVFYDIFA